MTTPLAEIKALLQANVEPLARTLAPHGKRSGAWWLASNPTREDREPSFGIVIASGAPGAWKDFATGDKGDVLQLIGYVNRLSDMRAILDWARGWLGIDGAQPSAVAEAVVKARATSAQRDRDAAMAAERDVKRAKGIYLASKKRPFVGSPADLYLRGRGLNIEHLPRLPGALGWLPDQMHRETKTVWPAMIAQFCRDNETVAVHRTYLGRRRSDGAWQKAPVKPARKIWPAFSGAAIRLWRGASGLSIDDAAKHGLIETLVLVEGVEDGLSVALSCPDKRVWCAGSLGNLSSITLPACVDEVIVCADNDWGKPECEKQLRRALDALAAQGARVRVARSSVGKDMNDALLG